MWWLTVSVPALRREEQIGLRQFKASLIYKMSSRTARITQENPVLENKTRKLMCVSV